MLQMKFFLALLLVTGFPLAVADSLLLGNARSDIETFDACTSADGTCGVVAGVCHGVIGSVYVAQVTGTPSVEWERSFNYSNGSDEFGFGICHLDQSLPVEPDAEYALCGYIDGGNGADIPAVYLLDEDGFLLSCEMFESYAQGCFKSVIQTRDGGLALLGETNGNLYHRAFVMSLDQRMDYRWHKAYNGVNCDSYVYPNSLLQTEDAVGDYLVALVNPLTNASRLVCFDNTNNGNITDYVLTC